MSKIAAVLLLSLGMVSAHAVPIVFTSSTYTTFALADVDGVTDGPDSAIAILPSGTLPINSSASVIAGGGPADASATANNLSLTTSTGASSTGGLASADAVTTLLGTFITPGGLLSLLVDFADTTVTGGAGLAGSTLAVSLAVNGASLFDQSFSSTQLIDNDFLVPGGLLGELEITLTSFASSSINGDTASNLATVSFAADAAAIPEPATLALIFGGFGLLGLSKLSRGVGARAAAL